jgi:hypothetical protein
LTETADSQLTGASAADAPTDCPAAIRAAGPAARAAWDDFVAGAAFRPATRYRYRTDAARFLRWLEPQGIELGQVTPQLVERFLDTHDVSLATKGMYRTGLRRFFDALVARQAVPSNPADQAGCGTDGPLAAPPAGSREATPVEDGRSTLEELKAFLYDLDRISEDSDYFRPGLVAMYPIVVGGMDPQQIAAFTGIPLPEVELYAGRLRENGVWTPDGKIRVEFEDPDSLDAIIELVMHIGCARGAYIRTPAADDEDSGQQNGQPVAGESEP